MASGVRSRCASAQRKSDVYNRGAPGLSRSSEPGRPRRDHSVARQSAKGYGEAVCYRDRESLEFRWLVGPTGILEEAEGREGGRHLLSITCSQAAGIAKGRPFEKLVRSGIFDRANRGQEILARRSGIRGGFAPKK